MLARSTSKATWSIGRFYQLQRQRGKGPNIAITITARRMAVIAWKMRSEGRDYSEATPNTKTMKRLSSAALAKV